MTNKTWVWSLLARILLHLNWQKEKGKDVIVLRATPMTWLPSPRVGDSMIVVSANSDKVVVLLNSQNSFSFPG